LGDGYYKGISNIIINYYRIQTIHYGEIMTYVLLLPDERHSPSNAGHLPPSAALLLLQRQTNHHDKNYINEYEDNL